jgi:hypothetical protein
MSAYNSGFVTGTNSIGGDTLTPFVPVHERPAELIDGGSAGEHYHLTEDQHTDTLAILAIEDIENKIETAYERSEPGIRIYEPMISDDIENDNVTYIGAEPKVPDFMTDEDGDIMVGWAGEYAT